VTSPPPLPVLYSFRRCPYAMRARMALVQARQNVELREIALKNKPAAMLEASPKGTVPVLVLPDGTVLEESLEIMNWALSRHDPDGWLKADPVESAFLIQRNDGVFKQALDRYKYPDRLPEADSATARHICEDILKDLERRLQNNDYLMGKTKTLADIALFPFIRQCAFVDRTWYEGLDCPNLQRWLQEHLESLLFQIIMKKRELWTPEALPTLLFSL